MSVTQKRNLLQLPSVLAFTLLFSTLGDLRAASVKLSYDAYAGPLYVMSARVSLSLEGDRYRIETQSKTEGFASWCSSWNRWIDKTHRQTKNPQRYIRFVLHKSRGVSRSRCKKISAYRWLVPSFQMVRRNGKSRSRCCRQAAHQRWSRHHTSEHIVTR